MATKTDWNPVLRGEFDKPYWRDLQAFVRAERERHTRVPAAPTRCSPPSTSRRTPTPGW